ncbi:hypothetical protein NQ318_009294 [Aromia moschata]|uniref:Glycoside hydrolase family 5 domain-containing protein n=1 Tax=Aromia moschata TaxID=1265417 RepID=A0AAV8YK45_9CUCU|nr:hypothetical protein NQ318_009294 [Aromia moschata]
MTFQIRRVFWRNLLGCDDATQTQGGVPHGTVRVVHQHAVSAQSTGFSVSGTTIYDATGAAFLMRGVSLEYTWFKSDLEISVPAIAETGANIVRVVLANGDVWDKDDAASVEKVINLLSEYKMITMLEVHDATGKDDVESLNSIVNYWIEIKDVLQGKEDQVIINIANEWYSQDNAQVWGDAYVSAVKTLRDAGLAHMFVIDAAGWGQYPDVIPSAGPAIFEADALKNTVFSIHMYANAGKDEETVKKNIDNALAINIPVIIGEFAKKDIAIEAIISYTQETSVGWLAWSWYGNNDPTYDMATGSAGTLTEYGEQVVNGDNGIKATSVLSKVFGPMGYPIDPSLASLSASSFPGTPECPGTHSRTSRDLTLLDSIAIKAA